MWTIGDMNAAIWIIFNHQWADLEIIGGEDLSRQIWSKRPTATNTWTWYTYMVLAYMHLVYKDQDQFYMEPVVTSTW